MATIVNNDTVAIIERMFEEEAFRKALVARNLFWFSHFYFPDAFSLPTADFQKEIFQLLESETKGMMIITAARKSGKSTIVCEHYPLYEILSRQKVKSVVIVSRTERQAKDHLANIKRDLENPANILLTKDWGPFRDESDQWGQQALVFPQYNARIIAGSVEQSIRGMRYRQYRPDLIILDDIEDNQSVSKVESRDKIFRWVNEDAIPAMADNARIIFLGTPLHEDSVMMRMKAMIEKGELNGTYRAYPILTESGEISWPGRYPDMAAIEDERKKVSARSWAQEFMLQIVNLDDQIINPGWFQYYGRLPQHAEWADFRFRIISVDPAISQKDTADCTAIVCADVYGSGDDLKIFILPNPINRRGISAKDAVELVRQLWVAAGDSDVKVVVESVSAWLTHAQLMQEAGIPNVIPVTPGSQNKGDRLGMAAYYVQSGRVWFPENGVDDLASQLVNFGQQTHDDLADAFSQLVIHAAQQARGGWIYPGSYLPPLEKLDRFATDSGEADRLRREAERKADLELINEDTERRMRG